MEKIIESLRSFSVVPVVKLNSADDALPLAEALREGGLACAEITFRTDAAEESIKRISAEKTDFFIAAGTVLSANQADRAINAGASLIVSPGFNPKVVEHCLKNNYPIIPGVCTPSEIELALEFGLRYLKFFPAEASGGVKMIKALSAPYSMVSFMPTGGISESNLTDYLALKSVFACGGSWMVPADMIENGNFAGIKTLTEKAVCLVKEFRK